jgi:uncharacterized protein YndB with AHSA1/START domain
MDAALRLDLSAAVMAEMLHEVVIGAPARRVYEALATREGLRGWWTDDAEMEPRVGSVAVFGFGNRATVFRMRIDDLVPGRRVVWSCEGEPGEWQDTQLTFELAPTPSGGTRLRFSHAGWRSLDGCFATCNSRWGMLMHRLKAYAEGEEPGPHFPPGGWAPVRAR